MPLRSRLCGGQSGCLVLPEPLFNNLSLMNPGIVILEYAHATKSGHLFKHKVGFSMKLEGLKKKK